MGEGDKEEYLGPKGRIIRRMENTAFWKDSSFHSSFQNTNKPTNSIVQTLSWEASMISARQDIPKFYGTRNFITAFTTANLLSLCLAGPIHSLLPHPTFQDSL